MGVTNKFLRCFVLLFFLIPLVDAASCGETIDEDTNLTSDLNCSGHGLLIGADSITLDCKGYLISRNEPVNMSSEQYFFGILLQNRSNVTIKNCETRFFWLGILLNYSNDCSLINNTVRDNGGGVGIFSSSSNNLTSNVIISNYACVGIIDGSENNIFTGNTVNGSIEDAIHISWSDNNIFINNVVNHNSDKAFEIQYSSNHTLTGNFIDNNGDDGIYLHSVSYTLISNNTLSNNREEGIYLSSSSESNNVTLNTIITNGGSGIDMRSSSNHIISNNLSNNDAYGIYLTSSNNILLSNTVNHHIAFPGIGLYGTNNTVINNTANYNEYGIYVSSYTDINDNTVKFNFKHGIFDAIGSTNITLQNNIVCFNNQGNGNYSDIYARSNMTGLNNTCDTTFNYNDTNTHGCINPCVPCSSNLLSDITLNANLTCNGTALTIAVDNITLDCDGHLLTGNGTGYGVSGINKYNITIQNCVISNFQYGIYLRESENNYLNDNIINDSERGIFISLLGNNTLLGNIANNNIYEGIYIGKFSHYNRLYNNTAGNNGRDGIFIYSASNNTLIDNIADSNGEHGFYIMGIVDTDIGNTLYNNRFCFNINQDIYDIGTTTGDNNTCNTVHKYNDTSVTSGCVYNCHRCDLVTGWNLISLPLTI
ncbi:MAG: right-handed parallel beta-helix repeat-containing protein [Candidatus Altiarchaeota archaeon]